MTGEEAIKILEEIIDEGWLISDFDKCTAIDACELAIKAIEQTRWIPVSERLPKSDVDVLTQYSDGSMSVDFRTASSSGWFWADEDLPIAWMPLPEPYEAQESEEV